MPIYPETMPPDILQTIWDEIANITTIAPMLCLFATNYIANKINPNISGHIRILWNTIGVVMLLFYRVFIALGLHPVLLAGEGIVHFILCFAILCYQGIGREEINYKGSKKILEGAIKKIKNKDILGIQILEMQTVYEGKYIIFKLKSKDCLVNDDADVNGILSINLKLLESDYNYFQVVYRIYKEVVDTGSDEKKIQFQMSLDDAVKGIIRRLSSVDVNNIKREDCCLARLLLCYINLKKMIQDPDYAIVELNDGEIGIDIELEKRLFTLFRTGLLGAILFGDDQRYVFRYRRDGHKIGRKYCAFPIKLTSDPQNGSLQKGIICVFALKESEFYDIPYSVMQCIKKYEKMISNFDEEKGGE